MYFAFPSGAAWAQTCDKVQRRSCFPQGRGADWKARSCAAAMCLASTESQNVVVHLSPCLVISRIAALFLASPFQAFPSSPVTDREDSVQFAFFLEPCDSFTPASKFSLSLNVFSQSQPSLACQRDHTCSLLLKRMQSKTRSCLFPFIKCQARMISSSPSFLASLDLGLSKDDVL